MDASIRSKSLGLTILVHGLILLALFFFAITTRIPPFEEGTLAGGGGGEAIIDIGQIEIAAEGKTTPSPTAAPVEQASAASEEILTSELEETTTAPVHKKETVKKKVKETAVKNKKTPVKEVAVVKPIAVPKVDPRNVFQPKKSQGTSSTAEAGDQGARTGQEGGSMFPGTGGSGGGTGTGTGTGSGPGIGGGHGPFAGLDWGAGGGRSITYAPQFRSKTNEPGKVRLKIFVDENGNVTRVDRDAIQTLNPEQVEEAIAYVKKVKFSKGSGISIAYPTIEFSAK